METKDIKSIPYGLSDYARLVRDNYYYVDKTRFIPAIEQAASYFFLIRPRRFGKTLLLNMLAAYYDINNAQRFEELFSERWIYTHPTGLQARFMVLRFNFSAVDSTPANLVESFESHCSERFLDFGERYEYLFYPGFTVELMQRKTAADRLSFLNNTASRLGLRLYLFIDEYDNFTNTILSSIGENAYKETTHGEGFYRYFFNVVKAMTSDNGSALERIFITGVSPVTLDDVTSGFNIASNFTTDFRFNSLVGFSEEELREMLEYYRSAGLVRHDPDELIACMKPWYDNYCFAEECLGESMYNSDMVLYFLNYYVNSGTFPKVMIDNNIRTDYNKLRYLVRIDRERSRNFSTIREIVNTGQVVTRLNSGFPVEEIGNADNFRSLLYYFGLVSIAGVEMGDVVLRIPNQVVREQLYSYLIDSYKESNIFTIDFDRMHQLFRTMSAVGDWQPVFRYIASELERQSRIREFIDGEAHVKGFLLAYLGMTNYYMLMPEYELGKGYADFYFRPSPHIQGIEYGYLMEVKCMKRSDPESLISTLKAEARSQLLRYVSDPIVKETIGTAQLKLITLVFRGWELTEMEEVEQ